MRERKCERDRESVSEKERENMGERYIKKERDREKVLNTDLKREREKEVHYVFTIRDEEIIIGCRHMTLYVHV